MTYRSPHACGDGPLRAARCAVSRRFSPRVWGWSARPSRGTAFHLVLPTRVGMVRRLYPRVAARGRSPHACGDGPRLADERAGVLPFSPRVWGWSVLPMLPDSYSAVLPTRVGMVRRNSLWKHWTRSSPHACGDGPVEQWSLETLVVFSPRVWGWSGCHHYAAAAHGVLPTRVGMVRPLWHRRAGSAGSPHACGDGPAVITTPRLLTVFSPRVWGWSGIGRDLYLRLGVLPTRVGMVLTVWRTRSFSPRSPHACGDGPWMYSTPTLAWAFSPRVWGWSGYRAKLSSRLAVLPTRVGMVR